MKKDGLFYWNDEKPFTQTWEDGHGYRLEPVTSLPGTLEIPPFRSEVFRQESLPSELIVVGERGGGLSHFLTWLTLPESNWDVMDLGQAAGRLTDGTLLDSEQIVVDATRPSEDIAQDQRAMARMAYLLESREWEGSGKLILVTTRDVHQLEENETVYSVILARGHAYRLPHFVPEELVQWLRALVDKRQAAGSDDWDQEALARLAVEVHNSIGGQPTLTHFLFRLLDEDPEWNEEESLMSVIRRSGEHILLHRPHLVRRWGGELSELLKKPEVRRRLESYVAGNKKPVDGRFDRTDVDLYLAGWIGPKWKEAGSDPTHWGICSRCHQQWAREILREVRTP
jgi:hypothetical protein